MPEAEGSRRRPDMGRRAAFMSISHLGAETLDFGDARPYNKRTAHPGDPGDRPMDQTVATPTPSPSRPATSLHGPLVRVDHLRHFYGSSDMPVLDDVNRRVSEERARQSAYAYSQSSHPSYYQPTSYGSGWDQHAWNGVHRYDCGCSTCTYQHHYRPYPIASSYAAQTVMG